MDSLCIETRRLTLRVPRLEELDDWAAYMADAESQRYLGGVVGRSQAWRMLMSMIGSWHAVGFAMFSVYEKESGRWIGRLGPWQPADWPGTEIGWGLTRESRGRGYATEGSIAAINWAFDTLGWTEIIHSIDPDNHPSQALARRLGSTRRGPGRLPEPHENAPIEIWGQTREAWRSRHPQHPNTGPC